MTLNAGDIVWANLSPTLGHEQRGHRPALVVSETALNHTLAIVVPLTSKDKGRRSSVRLTTSDGSVSVALVDQVRSIDVRSRVTKKLSTATPADLDAVRTLLAHMIGRY